MAQVRIAVTGATGAVGGRIARRLVRPGHCDAAGRQGCRPGAETRASDVAVATYLDRPVMAAAMRDIDAVFFVSGFEAEDRLAHHKSAVEAFAKSGVGWVVYTSFLNATANATFTLARDHFHTEQYPAALRHRRRHSGTCGYRQIRTRRPRRCRRCGGWPACRRKTSDRPL